MKLFKKIIDRNIDHLIKYDEEILFWKNSLEQLILWFDGEISSLYGEPNPDISQKSTNSNNKKDNSILTWHKLHQQKKYLDDLRLDQGTFAEMKLLDIGSGPIASANVFSDCEVYCLDPLLPKYLEIGYPIHLYDRTKFVHAFAESIPFNDAFFDAVITVNALDHVDNFEKVTSEIGRVLKPNGLVRMHLHYHPKYVAEPIVLNDRRVLDAFSWCTGLKKISESKKKRGYSIPDNSEDSYYTLWSNF